jgi:hypothetical protein
VADGNLFAATGQRRISLLPNHMDVSLSICAVLLDSATTHRWGAHEWSLVLNILKFVGAALTGVAGVIGILTETKAADPLTPDRKHLTRPGKILLSLGVAGLAIALVSQIVEWVKTGYDAEAAQIQNSAVLSEIRKAVTRFETISLDVTISLPLDEPLLKPYKDNLDKRLEDLEMMGVGTGQVYKGIRVGTKSKNDWEGALISISPDSEALPTAREGAIADLIKDIPRVAFYKPPVDRSKMFVRRSDLTLVPTPGEISLEGVLGPDGKLQSLGVKRHGMDAPANRWSPSGNLISLEQLPGTQAVIFLPGLPQADGEKLWGQCFVSAVFYFNYQRVSIAKDPSRIKNEYGNTEYSYEFVERDVKQ